jgi:hypothetical protein
MDGGLPRVFVTAGGQNTVWKYRIERNLCKFIKSSWNLDKPWILGGNRLLFPIIGSTAMLYFPNGYLEPHLNLLFYQYFYTAKFFRNTEYNMDAYTKIDEAKAYI